MGVSGGHDTLCSHQVQRFCRGRLTLARAAVAFLLAAVTAVYTCAWTPDQMMEVKSVGDVQVSPDGRRVAFTVTQHYIGSETSEPRTQIWIAHANGSHAFALTSGEKSSSNPRWSPDGRWIGFLSDRSGHSNIWVVNSHGGEPEQLTFGSGIGRFLWSNSGQWIAFTAPVDRAEDKQQRTRKKEDWQVVDTDFAFHRLWIIPVQLRPEGKREPRLLTPQEFHLGGAFGGGFMDWAPDDSRIVFAHMPRPRFDDWRKTDISEVEIGTGRLRSIAATEAAEDWPLYSPDGRWIAYRASSIPPGWGMDFHVRVVAASGGAPRPLAETFNRQPVLIGWTGDSRSVIVQETRGTSHALYRLPLEGPTVTLFNQGEGSFGSVTLNHPRSMIGFTYQGSDTPPEAFISPLDAVAPHQVSRVSEILSSRSVAKTRVIRWKAPDGPEIEGLLTYPANYRDGTRYPLLVICHGGPPMAFTQTFIAAAAAYPIAAFSARGYAVLRPNVRGSTGYGKAFRYANYADWGGGDFRDVMAGVDHVIRIGVADPHRLGIMGWSYGGYLTAWTITQTARFKAASIGAPVTNLASLNGTADMATFVPDYFGGESWDKPDVYIKHSPVFRAKGVSTPTLMQHGTQDTVVPLSQGQEFYNALVRQGVPIRMVLYPRSGHGIRESKFLRHIMQENLDWFDKYLKPPQSE